MVAGFFMKKQYKLLMLSLILLATGCFVEAVAFGTKGLPDWLDYLLLPGGIVIFIAGVVTFIQSIRTNS